MIIETLIRKHGLQGDEAGCYEPLRILSFTALHYIVFHSTLLCSIELNYIKLNLLIDTLHCIVYCNISQYAMLPYITLHLHYTMLLLHYITLHYCMITLHYICYNTRCIFSKTLNLKMLTFTWQTYHSVTITLRHFNFLKLKSECKWKYRIAWQYTTSA